MQVLALLESCRKAAGPVFDKVCIVFICDKNDFVLWGDHLGKMDHLYLGGAKIGGETCAANLPYRENDSGE